MIEINLLPPELREEKRKKLKPFSLGPKKAIIVAGVLLLLFNILIPVLVQFNRLMLQRFEDIYSRMRPQIGQVDEVNGRIQRIKELEAIVSGLSGQRTLLAQKLNIISDSLPKGVWLSRVSFGDGVCEIKGRCVLLAAQEMAGVKQFLIALKGQTQFSSGLGQLELKSAQRKSLGAAEVIDFSILSKPQVKPPADKVKRKKKKS